MTNIEPWALVFGTFLGHNRILRLPERLIPWAETHGWRVLVRDTDIPNADLTGWHVQSNPRRKQDHGSVEGD